MATDREMFEKVWTMDAQTFLETLLKVQKDLGFTKFDKLPKTSDELNEYFKKNNWVVLGNVEDGMMTEANGYTECERGTLLDVAMFASGGPETWKGKKTSDLILGYLASMHFDGWVDLFNHYDERIIPALKKELGLEKTKSMQIDIEKQKIK